MPLNESLRACKIQKFSKDSSDRVYWVLYSFENSQKSMANKFSSYGLCISSNRVDETQPAITQNVCQQYRLKETVSTDSLV